MADDITNAALENVLNSGEEKISLVDEIKTVMKEAQMPTGEYLTLSDGIKVYKDSVGAEVYASLMKQQKFMVEQEQALMKQKYAMNAEKEYPYLSGTPEEKGEFLFAIQSLDEKSKNYALSLMKANNDYVGRLCSQEAITAPSEDTPHDDVEENNAKIEEIASELIAKNPNLSMNKARFLAYRQIGG